METGASIAMTVSPTLFTDLLERHAAIDRTIDGIKAAQSVFMVTTATPPYPKILNRVGAWEVTYSSYGAHRYTVRVDVIKTLVVGSVQAGFKGQNEIELNNLYGRILDKYLFLPQLNDPTTGEVFGSLVPDIASRLIRCTGSIGIQFDRDSGEQFYASDFTFEASLLVTRNRKG